MSENKSSPADVLCDVLALEESVWQALLTGDMAADKQALHAEFLGVYPSGFATRQDHMDQLKQGPSIASYRLSQTRLLQLGPAYVCLCYHARFTRINAEAEEAMYVSSIWQRAGQGWVNIFSQDTPESAES